jgi:hypothetical protein
MGDKLREYDAATRARLVKWLMDGLEFYNDEIDYTGDWVYISVYLPEVA